MNVTCQPSQGTRKTGLPAPPALAVPTLPALTTRLTTPDPGRAEGHTAEGGAGLLSGPLAASLVQAPVVTLASGTPQHRVPQHRVPWKALPIHPMTLSSRLLPPLHTHKGSQRR